MGQAREVMDRLTTAVFTNKDVKAAAECYAADAVAITPDAGTLTGRDAIGEYMRQLIDAVPDVRYEYVAKHECGDVAVDEGMLSGTNTGPLELPSGERLPATNKALTVRGCDVVTVRDGLITEHRFYFDQVEFLGQLGLMPELPA